MGVTIIYKAEPYTEHCQYAHILTELGRKVNVPNIHHMLFYTALDAVVKESRLLSGAGTTSVERRGEQYNTTYLVQTHLGENKRFNIAPGFSRLHAWTHRPPEEEPAASAEPSQRDTNTETEIAEEQIVYPLNVLEDEFTLSTPKTRLQKKGRRGTQ